MPFDNVHLLGHSMQVVVLAGGFGTRLYPWTHHIPKPMLPMLDKTLMERVVENVPSHLVDEVVIAAGYKIRELEEYFRSKDLPFDVRIVEEEGPLGTGGALGNCRDVLSGTFACFNGDIVSSLDATNLLDLHAEKKATATLGLWSVEDPTRFGIVGLDQDFFVTQFKEKPKPEEVFSNYINAGSYIMNEEIFEYMPTGKHSLEREVFPILAEENKLCGLPFEGYFIDAGTPNSWKDAIQACITHQRYASGFVDHDAWFADHIIEAGIEGGMISKGCSIHATSNVQYSTLLEHVQVEENVSLSGCLVGANAHIGSGSRLENVVIDFNAYVPEHTVQSGGTYPNTSESS
jgi:mannose-1-phosphate guanylyltransferase